MKIIAHVIALEDCGDRLGIRLQGKAVGESEMHGLASQTVRLPMTNRNRRAYFIGREIEIEVTPK